MEKEERITIRVTKEEKELIKQIAKELHLDMSNYLRIKIFEKGEK